MAKTKLRKKITIDKEICPKCQHDEFAIDKGINANRHCTSCHHVRNPLSLTEIQLHQYKAQYGKALDFAKNVQSQLDSLITEIDILGEDLSMDKVSDIAKLLEKEAEIICGQELIR